MCRPLYVMPNKFYTSSFIAHLEFYIDVLCVLKLPNIVYEEIVKNAACLQRGRLSTFKTGICLGPGDLANWGKEPFAQISRFYFCC